MKVGKRGIKLVVAAEWVDEEVQFYIKDRKDNNKDWRQTRNKKAPQDIQDFLKNRYIEQQTKTSRFLGMKKGEWERKKVQEAKQNSKILWNVVKEISATTRSKDEQVYVYREDNTKHKIEEEWKPYIQDWTKDIYQKTPRICLDFWYGTENYIGLKEEKVKENIENMNRGQDRMMPLPVMKEKDSMALVNKQKNNKTAGIDGVKAEVMEHMVKNKKIRKALLVGF